MTYYLNKAELPAIPVPHDCVVSSVSFSDDIFVLNFEQDMSRYDSVQHIHPNAKSLTIKMHLTDDFDIYQEKIRKFPWFQKSYVQVGLNRLAGLVKRERVEYLYHYVAYESLIVNLWYHKTNIAMYLQTDCIEYIWKE